MKKYKCQKCGSVVGENETYLDTMEGKISMDPRDPDKQTSFPRPIRKHKGGCSGKVVSV
jgi:hypothetical protein